MMPPHFEYEGHAAPTDVADTLEFAAFLRGAPGQWALYGTREASSSARTEAYSIRRGGLRGDKLYSARLQAAFSSAGSFEATAVTLFGEHRIYVRFVGTKEGTS